jgi:hypothetical protein
MSIDNLSIILNDKILENDYIPENKNDRLLFNLNNEQMNFQYKSLHWGQRKLFLSELHFLNNIILNKYKNFNKFLIIYAGAAPGTHLNLLSHLFPYVEFHLYDPNQFDSSLIKNKKQFKINPLKDVKTGIFNENIIKQYLKLFHDNKNKYDDYIIIFISDIRGNDISKIKEQNNLDKEDLNNEIKKNMFENIIYDDLNIQKQFVSLLNAHENLLKFRLPFNNLNLDYLNGPIYIQPWNSISGTETRLHISNQNYNIINYSLKKYERQLAFINVHLRHLNLSDIKLSDIDIILYDDLNQNFTLFDIWKNTGEKNMNNRQLHNNLNDSKQTINKQFISFDCYLETLIIYNYIKLMYQTVSIHDIIKYINMLTKNLKKNKFNY